MSATLVVNIGNTNIRFGLFCAGVCENSWVINTKPYRTSDELSAQFSMMYQMHQLEEKNSVEHIIVGSVVPQLTHTVLRALYKIHGQQIVLVDGNTPSSVQKESPQMGTDIYANLVAAHELYDKQHKIIIDFGTALTASCVDAQGQTQGVVIAPGIITSLNSLVGQTAQLPEIELKQPPQVLGNDTISCMQSGMVYGFLGMVEGLIERIQTEVKASCHVIATGGVSHIFAPLSNHIHVADRLHTLKGLYLLGRERLY